MKKLSVVWLLCALLSFAAAALEDTAHSVHLTYDNADDVIRARISVEVGDAIVGHFGLSFNSEKLRLVTRSGDELLSPAPVKNEDGESYLCSVVKAAGDGIVITPESNKPADLINQDKGIVLFGWYATKELDAVTPDISDGGIAEIYFKTADGVTVNDLTPSDIAPVSAEQCAGISGWGNGIIVINSQSKVFSVSPADGAALLNVSVTADFSDSPDVSPTPDKPEDVGQTDENAETPSSPEDPDPGDVTGTDVETDGTGTTEEPEESGAPFAPNGKTAETDFSLTANAFENKVRLFWEKPANTEIYSYTVHLKDTDGNTVRKVDGIVGEARSLTLTFLAPDFAFVAEISAYTTDGSLLTGTKSLAVRTEKMTAAGEPIAFGVTYDPGMGELYGFDSEQVLFGSLPTKAPVVYAPDGYVFKGWSADGKNTVSLSSLRIYKDTALTALYAPEESE